jgi:hypothetical protein
MFIVTTQTLENYGAHAESGKFSDGQNYWKFKGGDTYLVEDLDREQDAVAFVAALVMDNGIGYKEYPSEMQSCRDYYLSQVIRVSPNTVKSKNFKPTKGMKEQELEVF